MTRTIGIDLGTTYSAVATSLDGVAEILPNRDGDRLTPSVVAFEGGQPLVGKEARNLSTSMPEDYVEFVKRKMGESGPEYIDENGKEYGPEQISALLLRRLADDAAAILGEDVRDAVITVPAYFDDGRRMATRDAAEIAGLNPMRLINEPTAAGIAYGLDFRKNGMFLVYDLGGGTFDATLMKVENSDITVLATGGDRNLGGFDFDNKIMTHVAAKVLEQGGPPMLFDSGGVEAELRRQCEAAKRRLSRATTTSVRMTLEGKNYQVPLSRATFEEITNGLLTRTEITLEGVLDDAEASWEQVDRVLLIGGSTRMPMISDMIERLSGRKPDGGINPDDAVALGAAMYAESLALGESNATEMAALTVRDVTSHALGTPALDESGNRVNTIIIPRNAPVPCQRERVYTTVEDGQRVVNLDVTEGDDTELDYVTVLKGDNIPLPRGLRRGTRLQVVMAYDVDGVIHAEVFLEATGVSLGEVQLHRENNLTREEVSNYRAQLAGVEIL
ncbi:Hsp70 family protein [Spiractinospora alimapuensis]|uniref:Hsp70 family protein n=1 Tax=Spiractinospora alimapuensis TaxID=2820884 RepID=UPI001F20D9C7|nr:Hsp70 family protein [Spiractinospora alimapuensis]QVQ51702.1 Hsp70 family protein [Spiractinospora alimapuensis]